MVVMPLPSSSPEAMANSPSLGQMMGYSRAILQSLAAKYGVRYVDMSSVVNEDALFWDEQHLNDAGTHVFTPLLATACYDTSPLASS